MRLFARSALNGFVRNAEEHSAALARIDALWRVAEPGTPEGDEFEALAAPIDAYGEKHFPIAAPDPITCIEVRLEQQGLTRKGLEPMIGSRARVSEIMAGKRQLTLPMIRRLRDGLGIPADVLIGEAKTDEAKGPSRKARPRKATASHGVKPAAAKTSAAARP